MESTANTHHRNCTLPRFRCCFCVYISHIMYSCWLITPFIL